jgi:hypothetical protein
MLYEEVRVIYDNGSTLSDYSIQNQDESATVTLALSSTKFLYIAQKCPFTSLFFYKNTSNVVVSSLKIEYWDGTQWREVADLLDDTSVAGAPLSRSGVVKCYLDDDYSWQKVYDTSDYSAPSELQTLKIYEMYWLRISSLDALTAGANAKQIAYTFTSTQELNNYDVEISGYYESFETGKLDWIKEIITASKLTLMEMKRRGLATHNGQLLELDDFNIPASYKALELIYSNLGPSYVEKRKWASEEFAKSLNVQRPVIDTNKDGKITGDEGKGTPRMLQR